MKALAYYDGKIGAPEELTVPFYDRANFFGDGCYDAAMAANGAIFLLEDHLDRFYTSARLLDIHIPMEKQALGELLTRLTRQVEGESCFVYWQVSRGVEPRSHTYAENLPGKLWVLVRPQVIPNPNIPIRLNDEEDTRFFHCNIKSLNLLCNVMTAQRAHRAGCTETVFYRGDIVTECAHSNVSVLKDGVLYSHPNDEFILRGIAKSHMIRVCYRLGIPVLEKPFTLDFLKSADEILEQEDIEDACRDAWMQILAIAAPAQQSAMYEWFAAAFRTWQPLPYFTAPLAFLFSYPWDEAIHQRNLALLDEKIAEWKLNAQERGGGAMVNLLNQREKTMQQLHASQEDIIGFWHSHWDVPYAHDRTLKTLMAAEKWTEAIEQVKADLQTFAGEYMPCKQRREQLILLYQRANQPDLAQREIRQYIEQYNQYSMEQIDALRATLPADAWRDEAERLLKLPTTSTIRLPLLASIEQWEQLLQRIQQHGNFEGLCTYFEPLMAWDSARTLALYRNMVNRAMQAASSRAAYCEVIQQLERMKGTDEGRQIIADLAEQWRKDYKRKCALLDELQKAGY